MLRFGIPGSHQTTIKAKICGTSWKKSGESPKNIRTHLTTTSEVRGSRSEVRGSRSEVRGSRFEVRGSRFEVRGSRFEVRGSRSEVRGSRFEVVRGRRCHCQVRSQKFTKFQLCTILYLCKVIVQEQILGCFKRTDLPMDIVLIYFVLIWYDLCLQCSCN